MSGCVSWSVVLGGGAALLDVEDGRDGDVGRADAEPQLPEAAEEIVDRELGAAANLLPLKLGADAAAEAQLVKLAGLDVDLHVGDFDGRLGQIEPHRREHAQVVEPALRRPDVVRVVRIARLPGDAVEQLPRRDGPVSLHRGRAEAHLWPRLADEFDRRRVLVAVDVDAAANLSVRVAVFLQTIRQQTLHLRVGGEIEDFVRSQVAARRQLAPARLGVRRKSFEADLLHDRRRVLLHLDHHVDGVALDVLDLMAGHARVEVAVVGVERLDALKVEVEGCLVEPPPGRERPPARLPGRELVFDVARRQCPRPLDGQVMNPHPRRQLVMGAGRGKNQHHGQQPCLCTPEPTQGPPKPER